MPICLFFLFSVISFYFTTSERSKAGSGCVTPFTFTFTGLQAGLFVVCFVRGFSKSVAGLGLGLGLGINSSNRRPCMRARFAPITILAFTLAVTTLQSQS